MHFAPSHLPGTGTIFFGSSSVTPPFRWTARVSTRYQASTSVLFINLGGSLVPRLTIIHSVQSYLLFPHLIDMVQQSDDRLPCQPVSHTYHKTARAKVLPTLYFRRIKPDFYSSDIPVLIYLDVSSAPIRRRILKKIWSCDPRVVGSLQHAWFCLLSWPRLGWPLTRLKPS